MKSEGMTKDELKVCPFCGSKPTVDSNGVVWCPCFHESVETWNKRSNRAKTLSEISGEIVIDAEMKAVGQAFVKEFYQMQYQVHDLQAEVEATKAMVERLIEERKQLIAQLAAEKDKNEHMLDCIFEYETIAPDGQLGVSLLNMDNHIRSLEADNAELKEQLVIANELIERLK